MGYTAKVDRELCVSAGACVEAAPKVFGWDDEHLAEVLPGAEDATNDKLLECAKACPATAIFLYDEDGKEVDLFA